MAFCNPCVRPSNSSIVNYTSRPTISLKSLLRRKFVKKSPTLNLTRIPIHHSQSSARFQRIKGSNFVREINPNLECSFKTESTNNYDMTVYHDEQLDDTQNISSYRRTKKIPRWARKSQLQLAFINQIYFNDKNPDDIFGCIHMDLAHEMVQSIESRNSEITHIYNSPLLPPNFV
ncbi:unnamed protein product [Adineta steineri]|uniref:Inner centromere protein ARK-binding domain-containing protein n=1 Tax=Adineta steineri TaxID=433720 RepID=A0A818RAQ4_9BILA|nr:unnamed protein product [Adineta steineri]CAF0841025.1 unnamed protein product [Adineta steineri]CAF3496215.1 unnamed protein product [Adineta steineri]CAF3654110.1 unnamed protein product [Adineta steineri]